MGDRREEVGWGVEEDEVDQCSRGHHVISTDGHEYYQLGAILIASHMMSKG